MSTSSGLAWFRNSCIFWFHSFDDPVFILLCLKIKIRDYSSILQFVVSIILYFGWAATSKSTPVYWVFWLFFMAVPSISYKQNNLFVPIRQCFYDLHQMVEVIALIDGIYHHMVHLFIAIKDFLNFSLSSLLCRIDHHLPVFNFQCDLLNYQIGQCFQKFNKTILQVVHGISILGLYCLIRIKVGEQAAQKAFVEQCFYNLLLFPLFGYPRDQRLPFIWSVHWWILHLYFYLVFSRQFLFQPPLLLRRFFHCHFHLVFGPIAVGNRRMGKHYCRRNKLATTSTGGMEMVKPLDRKLPGLYYRYFHRK